MSKEEMRKAVEQEVSLTVKQREERLLERLESAASDMRAVEAGVMDKVTLGLSLADLDVLIARLQATVKVTTLDNMTKWISRSEILSIIPWGNVLKVSFCDLSLTPVYAKRAEWRTK